MTDEDWLLEIRRELARGVDPGRLAARLGVDRTVIVRIGRGLPWRAHLTSPVTRDLFSTAGDA